MKIKLIQGYEKIAAGEVIERPASVVKELVENALDAEAKQIFISLTNAGKDLIQITDNGCGIHEDEIEFAFQRHTSSKIETADQLDDINTLGFRGEALASIAAVSQIEIISRPASQDHGICLFLSPENPAQKSVCGAPTGTTIKIKNIFYNLPVRKKFLRSSRVELGHITDIITRYSLAYPLVHFKLEHNGLTLINSPQWRGNHLTLTQNLLDCSHIDDNLLSAYGFAIQNVYGKKISNHLIPVQFQGENFAFFGFIGHPDIARSERKAASLFVNHRLITNTEIYQIIAEAYKDYLMRNKFPFFVLFLQIPPANVDFNVHPSKKIIKFIDETHFFTDLQLSLSKVINQQMQLNYRQANQDLSSKAQKKYQKTAIDYWTPSEPSQQIPPISVDELVANALKTKNSETGPKKESKLLTSKNSNALRNSSKGDNSSATSQLKRKSNNFKKRQSPPSKIQTHFSLGPQSPNKSSPNPQFSPQKTSFQPLQANLSKSSSGDSNLLNSSFVTVKNLPRLIKLNNGIQAGENYLIFQSENELILIDQHAAHERINYERVQKWLKLEKLPVQRLISPIKIDVAVNEVDFVLAARDELKNYGFELDHFGANTFILRTIPAIIQGEIKSQQLIADLCLEIIQMGKEKSFSTMKREILQYMGCHKSIRAGDEIWNSKTIQKLIQDLDACENPHHCAHGRPTYIKISFKEIDKMFHRS